MKSNYVAWDVNPHLYEKLQSLEERLGFFIRYAVLAPSSHNAQPWRFSISSQSIVVYLDRRRVLPIGDPELRQTFIGLGCAVENIIIAADYYGYETTVTFLFEKSNQNQVARINFQASGQRRKDPEHLIHSIPLRVTNRNAYKNAEFDETLPNALESKISKDNLQLLFVRNQETKNSIADLVIDSVVVAMNNGEFRYELSRYLRSNFTTSNIGIPMFGMGFSTIASVFTPILVRYLNVAKLGSQNDLKILKKHTPVYGVIVTKEDSPNTWISVGRKYERAALEFAKSGMTTAPFAGVIEMKKHRSKLQSILCTTHIPQIFFRAGIPLRKTLHSPRIPAEDVKV